MEEKPPYEVPIDELIGAICKRPRMYVGMGGIFDSVLAYLCAWYGALEWCGAVTEDVIAWNEFCDWLHEKLNCPRSIVVFSQLRRACPDDMAALERLAALWIEYRGRSKSTNRTEEG